MWGLATKHYKTGVALIVVLAALVVGWLSLSHLWFVIIVACVGSAALLTLAPAAGGAPPS
ncbi:MAG: hypothetical protein ACRDMX_17305 [Solirubrobacteraceae bacterium]